MEALFLVENTIYLYEKKLPKKAVIIVKPSAILAQILESIPIGAPITFTIICKIMALIVATIAEMPKN